MKTLSKKEWIAVSVALVVIALFFLSKTFIFTFLTSEISGTTTATNTNTTMNTNTPANTPAASADTTSLLVKDAVVGTGAEAVPGKTITVNYTGKLTNGAVFDSSIPRGQPFQFVLGAGQVIAGWDQGLLGMKVGGKRTLIIPANMAYGNRAIGSIPANSTLIFDVELLGVK